jgi:hypothetical protein
MDQLNFAVKIFDQRRATFDPIAAVQILHAADFFYFRTMDVAANHAVGFLVARHLRQSLFVFGDKFYRRLGLKFQKRCERPIAKTERAAQPVEIKIKIENPVVKMRTKFFEQMVEMRQAVRLMAVNHQIFFPVGRCVHHLTRDGDIAKFHSEKLLDELIVVAGNVNHLGLLAAFAEEFLDERVVVVAPEPAKFQLPAVNKIANEIKILAIHNAQKIEQLFDARVARAEMDVGNPNRAIFFWLGLVSEQFGMGDHNVTRSLIPHALGITSRAKAHCFRIVTHSTQIRFKRGLISALVSGVMPVVELDAGAKPFAPR